jgi:hypothetical protein
MKEHCIFSSSGWAQPGLLPLVAHLLGLGEFTLLLGVRGTMTPQVESALMALSVTLGAVLVRLACAEVLTS